jgi:hypothetical protein
MNLYSAYDYLAFVIPGGLAISGLVVGVFGLPTAEPGASAMVGLLGLAFLIGHVLATIGSWAQPVAWGHAPGHTADPLWGVFGSRAVYSADEAEELVHELQTKYGTGLSAGRLYQLAYTDLQQAGKENRLLTLNSQIGFCRNTTIALIVAFLAQIVGELAAIATPGTSWLVPTYLAVCLVFIARYKRLWRQFGDNVLRGFRVLHGRQT